jgi:tetratricopeptide (TPR) repeat protein
MRRSQSIKSILKYSLFALLITSLAILSLNCGNQEGRQKIKLDSAAIREAQASSRLETTLQIQPEDRRSIAVFYFDNVTGDEELDWMRRGLTEMLITDLSQSRYLDVSGEHELESIMRRMGIGQDRAMDPNLAVSVAREAKLEIVLVGSFVRIGEAIRVDAQLYDARTGSLLKDDRVDCGGLEEVFTMVDELTRRVRDGLRPTLKDVVEFDKDLADATTTSIEAYRYFVQGLEQSDKYFYSEAANFFEKAVDVDTTFATAYARLAISYAAMSRGRDTRRTLAKAIGLVDRVTERERLNILALEAELKGNSREIIEIYEKMVRLFPRDKEAHFRLANVYNGLRRYEEAIQEYEAALAIDNTYIHPYNYLGYLYARQGQFDKGIEIMRKYQELVPDEPNPHDSMAEIHLTAGRFDEAVDELKRALELKSDFHFSWQQMGSVYADRGKFEQAIRHFRQYIEVCPSGYLKSAGYRFIGESHWAKGEYAEALKSFHEALKIYPDNFGLITLLGKLYEEKGDSIEAKKFREEWFWSTGERMLEEDNFDVVQYFVQASLYDSLHPEDMDPYLDKMMNLAENDFNRALCTYFRGVARLQQGKSNEALIHFRKSVPPFFSIETREGLRRWALKNISQAMAKASISPEKRRYFFEDIISLAKEMDNPTLETSARYISFEYYKSIGDDESLDRELKATGTPQESNWWVIGPFENVDGFQKAFPPERKIDLDKSYKGKKEKVQWRQAEDSVLEGYVDLKEIFEPDMWTVAYGLISIDCPTARQAQIRIGTNESTKVWLNDEEVWVYNFRRDAYLDDDIIPVELKEGKNTVLIKVCQKTGDWGFYFRITDPEGHAFGDISYLPQIVS